MQRAGPGACRRLGWEINDTPKTTVLLLSLEVVWLQTAIRLMISRRRLATPKLLRILFFPANQAWNRSARFTWRFDRIGKPKPPLRDSLHPPLQRPGKTGWATVAFQADFASFILEDLGSGGLESRAGNRITC